MIASDLLALIEMQLASMIAGIELDEGFGLFIVAGRTRLSARLAQRWLRERLPAAAHVELAADQATAQLPRVLAPQGTPSVLRLVADDADDVEVWRPIFRRLNENRNALARSHDAALVLIVAEEQIEALAAEAPDLWSVGVIRVVGWLGRVELLQAMASRYAVLEALTLAGRAGVLEALRAAGRAELMELVDEDDADRRARAAFELLLGRGRASERCVLREVEAWRLTVNDLAWLTEESRRREWAIPLDSLYFFSSPGPPAPTPGRHRARMFGSTGLALLPNMDESAGYAHMLDARQAFVHARICVCVAAQGMLSAALGKFVRRTFDLVFEILETAELAWEVLPGTEALAPLVRCPRDVDVHISTGAAHFELRYPPLELGGPEQLWLPGFDASSLGHAPLR